MKTKLLLAFALNYTIAFAQTDPQDTLNTPPAITTSHLSCSDFTTYNDWKSLSSGNQSYLFHCQGHERVLIGQAPDDGSGNNLTLDNDLLKELNIFGQGLIQRDGASASFTFLRTDGKGANMIAGQSGCAFQYDESGTFEIRSNSIDQIKLAQSVIALGAKTLLLINANGNIGIGTSAPISKLHLQGDLTIESSPGSGSDAQLSFRNNNGSPGLKWSIALDESLNNQLYFLNIVNNKRILTMLQNGHIGIGTNDPQQALHVQASGFTALRLDSRTGLATNGVQHQWDIGTDTDGKLVFNKEGITKLVIADTGNVGIGTTGPTAKLHIYGDAGPIDLLKLQNTNATNPRSFRIGPGVGSGNIFGVYDDNAAATRLAIDFNGNVGIGTSTPDEKLQVCGKIHAQEVIVNTTGCDFVFEPTYDLMSLSDLELYLLKHKHLPDIEPAKEMEADGIEIGEQYSKLLQKIEELTLYTIEQQKQIDKLKKMIY